MGYTYRFPRPALTVDAVVFRRNEGRYEVLLIKRKHWPYQGMWALPGGFVDINETVEAAIERELFEETHLKVPFLKQLHTFSEPGRDPRGHTVSVTFFGEVDPESSKVEGGDDALEAKWFDMSNLPELAFDHSKAVNMAYNIITKG
ncbi:MAG: NUDIX hydrolase [Bacteroidales bacterium]